ncbi:MAG: hypothetical protein LBG83_02175 [Oscillospiraceae bacterium]|jgi:hypothetical protein|nr:hypothetical protein [Oscillospiraceae bacterium]
MPTDEGAIPDEITYAEPLKDQEKLRGAGNTKPRYASDEDAQQAAPHHYTHGEDDLPPRWYSGAAQRYRERRAARAPTAKQAWIEWLLRFGPFLLLLLTAPLLNETISLQTRTARVLVLNYHAFLALYFLLFFLVYALGKPKSRLFQLTAQVLPVLAWVALRMTSYRPSLLFSMLVISLGGPLVYYGIRANRSKDSGSAEELEEKPRSPLRFPARKGGGKAGGAAVANFGATWMAGVMLVCLLIGIALQPRIKKPDERTLSAAAYQAVYYAENWNMERERVPGTALQLIARCDSALWKNLKTRDEKDEVLQALLDIECADLFRDAYPSVSIDARDVRRIVSKDGTYSIAKARASGRKEEDRQFRMECVCYVAVRLLQLHNVGPGIDQEAWETDAIQYAREKPSTYIALADNYLQSIAE